MATVTTDDTSKYELSLADRIWAPVIAGPSAGARWLPHSGGKTARVFLGTYERAQSKLFGKLIKPDDVLYDIGSACGYYTVLGSRLVGKKGEVLAFEPDPKNAAFTRAHVRINNLSNATVLETAVGDHVGEACFSKGTGTGTGRLSDEGNLRVPLTTVDAVLASGHSPPTHLKIDVEGGEEGVLRGATQMIAKHRPTLFLSTHGKEVREACCTILREWGYTLSAIEGEDVRTAEELLCQPAV